MPSNRGKSAEERRRWRKRTGSAPDHLTAARRREFWTPEEEALVVAHALPDRELAAQLNRSVNAIQRRRYELRRSGSLALDDSRQCREEA